jgi:glyoxylase-like metal-dependent hydrolase (beta-lactamase superfamily II)
LRLAHNLHRVGSDLVNVYLVDHPDGVIVIDTGLSGHFDEMVEELAAMGRTLDDVRGVILTHGDTDHIGFAERIHRDHGVPVRIHEDDAVRARLEVRKPSTGWGPVKLRPLARFLWYSARRGGLKTRPVTDLETFSGDGELDLPGTPRVIHIPGHTPGSTAVHIPHVEAVFVGDAMTTNDVLTGASGPRLAPFTLEPDQALASLAKLEGLPAKWILPGHGPPWSGGVEEALALIREAASRPG